ncbi:MAG: hypothetical protein ACREJB_10990 [Planctomycetaceae bacterium]
MSFRKLAWCLAPLAAITLSACAVEVDEEGSLPDVDTDVEGEVELPEVDVSGGQLPDVDTDVEGEVELPEVDVAPPDVDVDTEEKTITVPDIDVDVPEDPDQTEPEADETPQNGIE